MSLLFNMLSRLVIAFLKKQSCHFADKGLYSQSYCFSISHVLMWELDHKEGRDLKNWCFWNLMLKKTLECLDFKETKPANSTGKQHSIFIRRTIAERNRSSNTLTTWCKELTHWKRPWCWGRLRARGEEGSRGLDGWIRSLTQWIWVWANSRRQWRTGSLACCSPWGDKESENLQLNSSNNRKHRRWIL